MIHMCHLNWNITWAVALEVTNMNFLIAHFATIYDSGVFRGGHWAMPPPLWPEHKNFLNTLNQKNFFLNFWGGGCQTPSSVGRGHPLPTLHPIGASGASNLASLALPPPLHKILNMLLEVSLNIPGNPWSQSGRRQGRLRCTESGPRASE